MKFRAENSNGEEKTILGQIEKELSDVAIVLCYEKHNSAMMMKRTRINLKELTRARIKNGSICLVEGKSVRILEKSKKMTKTGLHGYYCEFFGTNKVRLVSEAKLIADYESAAVTTVDLLKQDKITNYTLWRSRENISDYYINSSLVMEGFDIAINSKIEMYEHQLETVRGIVANKPYRAMLSDEVGLGKSIEALVVLKYAIRNGFVNRAIIVVPSQLVQQWRLEATSKFSLDAQVFIYHSYVVQKKIPQVLIIGFDDYKKYAADYFEYAKWDFAIVDEAHKVIRDNKLYASIMKISKATENYLMLSATPILQRTEEYYNLLRLLFPHHYTSIGINKFNNVMKIREKIIDDVNYLAENLRYYKEYALYEDYLTRLNGINEVVNDDYLKELLERMSEQEDDSYNIAYIAVNYLSATYEIDSKFIRHRRQSVLDPTTKRILYEAIPIDSGAFDFGLNERDLKDQVIAELDESISNEIVNIDKAIQICNALFSSIGALFGVITRNKLEKCFPNTLQAISRSADKENFRMANLRLNTIIPVLKKLIETGDKIIIFTDYYETVSLIYNRLVKEFGDNKVAKFSSELSPAGMQIAVNKFKHDKACQILVCDKSGGEGRNFQFAEYIIHYDMPWSPADLEQRIGRLDRIGRKHNHNVKNIVFYEPDTVEEDLFNLYNNSLNIFEESLCGIEIVFEDMNSAIKDHLKKGVKIGFENLSETLCDLKKIAEDQISYENLSIMLQHSDDSYKNIEDELMKHFDESSTLKYQDAIASWIEAQEIGDCKLSSNPYRGAKIHIYESSKHNDCKVEGTFFVKDALEYEDVDFLTCQHPIVRELSEEVIDSNDGRFSAVKVNDSDVEWKGLILSWNLDLDIPDYFSGEWDKDLLPLTNEFITNNRIKIVYPMNDSKYMMYEDIINSVDNGLLNKTCEDISRSEIEDILDYSDLEEDVKIAIKETKSKYSEIEKSTFAQALLEKKIEDLEFKCQLNNQMKVSNTYDEKKLELYKALRKAMNAANGVLDSILFVCLEK
ncbi:SNF2-related protein [Butyrivibrio fibrisolvens]|uniref:SNF2-related protein n=1 Tax=Butyrivibrio fibrisolvens TaxID=831 RepID=UPI00200ACD54|nr:SNF2-related protein [Butyrivibrio fibrisolvens]